MTPSIIVQGIYAAATVRDLEAALAWYERFMGGPADDHPLPDMVQWRNMGAAGLELWRDDARAGNAVMTIVVPNLTAEKKRLAAEGISPATESSGDFGAAATFFDQENNRIIWRSRRKADRSASSR
jgi:predicted enzyme related to lactoylglutathione lyase